MSKTRTIIAAILLTVLADQSFADDVVAPAPVAEGGSCRKEKCRGNFSIGRLVGWATYRPAPVPRECRWMPYVPEPLPPLYTFFLHGYGEPSLMMTTTGCASGRCGR